MLQATHHDAGLDTDLLSKFLNLDRIEPPSPHKPLVLLRGDEVVGGELVRLPLSTPSLRVVIAVFEDNGLPTMEEYMSNLVKQAEPEDIGPLANRLP